jgi:hypothetical protein
LVPSSLTACASAAGSHGSARTNRRTVAHQRRLWPGHLKKLLQHSKPAVTCEGCGHPYPNDREERDQIGEQLEKADAVIGGLRHPVKPACQDEAPDCEHRKESSLGLATVLSSSRFTFQELGAMDGCPLHRHRAGLSRAKWSASIGSEKEQTDRCFAALASRVAEQARTRNSAAPAFAGCALVGLCGGRYGAGHGPSRAVIPPSVRAGCPGTPGARPTPARGGPSAPRAARILAAADTACSRASPRSRGCTPSACRGASMPDAGALVPSVDGPLRGCPRYGRPQLRAEMKVTCYPPGACLQPCTVRARV